MNEWVNKKYWGITDDYNAGIAELPDSKETEALFAKMKASGYQVPKKPKNFKSLYTVIYERFLEPRFELGVSKIIENKYKYSLIRKEIYRVLKSPKIISIFYNQDIRIIFYLFVPNFDRELLTPQERKEIFDRVEVIMENEEMNKCFFANFFYIYENLLQIIDFYNTQVNENNKRELVYNMKEEVKEFLKQYVVPDEILPNIDTNKGTFTGPRPARDIKLFNSPQTDE